MAGDRCDFHERGEICNAELVHHRLTTLEARTADIKRGVDGLAKQMTSIALLEEHHRTTRESLERCHGKVAVQDAKIRTIETELPVLRLTSKWVLAAVIGIFSAVSATAGHFMLKRVAAPPTVERKAESARGDGQTTSSTDGSE